MSSKLITYFDQLVSASSFMSAATICLQCLLCHLVLLSVKHIIVLLLFWFVIWVFNSAVLSCSFVILWTRLFIPYYTEHFQVCVFLYAEPVFRWYDILINLGAFKWLTTHSRQLHLQSKSRNKADVIWRTRRVVWLRTTLATFWAAHWFGE